MLGPKMEFGAQKVEIGQVQTTSDKIGQFFGEIGHGARLKI